MKNIVNIINSPKGGVGKSCTAALIAQYFMDNGAKVSCIDTDPTIKTFSAFRRFGATRVKGLLDGNTIDERAFDSMLDMLIKDDGFVHVVDTGSSGFVSFMNYLIEIEMLSLLKDNGKEIYYHVPIIGEQAQDECIAGLELILKYTPDFVKVVVWLNEYLTKIRIDGEKFEDSSVYERLSPRIHKLVTQSKLNQNTYGADVKNMLKHHLTYAEALNSNDFSFAAKQRLKNLRDILYNGLDNVFENNTKLLAAE